MKDWKIVLVHKGITIELNIQATSYSDAYIKAELAYPDCLIKSIRLENTKN